MYTDEIICNELRRIADSLTDICKLLSRYTTTNNSIKELDSGKQLINSEEAAKYLGINKHTLTVWRSNRRYNVPTIRVGRAIRYKKSDLDLWLATRRPD